MNKIRMTFCGLIVCGLALGVALSAGAQVVVGKAKVVRIKGEARYTTGGNVWQPLKVGAIVKPGTLIQTSMDRGSYVDLVFDDSASGITPVAFNPSAPAAPPGYKAATEQNALRIFENTVLGVDKLTSEQTGADVVTDTQLDLRAGHIFGSVKKMSPASRYEIKLPQGVAGIRGTLYELWANGDCLVLAGSVVVAQVKGDGTTSTSEVKEYFKFNAASGQLVPLSAEESGALEQVRGQLQTGTMLSETRFIEDRTIQYVSGNKGKGKGKGQTQE
jgi:hypothetical protein